MTNIAKIKAGRDTWKEKAVKRRKEAESKARQSEKWKQRYLETKEKLNTVTNELSILKLRYLEVPTPIIQINVKIICVFLFFLGTISCRSVPKILKFLKEIKQLNITKIPHWSSVSNWVCCAGLGLLQLLKPWPERPWIAIIDTTISYSKKKALVVLRLPLDYFTHNTGAPKLSDVECVGLEVGDIWNHITVKRSLDKIFGVVGIPALILKDGGYDLAKGVKYWSQEHDFCPQISDVGHVVANALKNYYAKNSVFQKFIELINKARGRLCQTDFSYLRPPKIRSKGRFQSIARVVEWSETILLLVSRKGKVKQNSLIGKLREAVPGLIKFKFFIFSFTRDCKISNEFMLELKNNGLNQNTYQKAKKILFLLPEKNQIRKILLEWLTKSLRIQCNLKMKQTPLPVSSDCIESLFGAVKHVIERNPIPEFGKMILVTPLLCGLNSQDKIEAALNKVSHKDLKQWEIENTQGSSRKQKRNLFLSPPTKVQIPDPPIAKTG